MKTSVPSLAWIVVACAALAACAGFRGGWESVPYVGDTAPTMPEARTAYEARQRSELALPGVTLGVGIDNQTRTYDTQVYLFVLPLSIDPRTVRTRPVEPGRTRITVRVTGTAGDFVFRPQRARLVVAGRSVSATGGFEFGMWDAGGKRVASGGAWGDRPVPTELALADAARGYLLSIDFPVPTPDPQSTGIALDLSDALVAPGRPALPLIRFQPARWEEGYT